MEQVFVLFSEQNNYFDFSYRFLFNSTPFFSAIYFSHNQAEAVVHKKSKKGD